MAKPARKRIYRAAMPMHRAAPAQNGGGMTRQWACQYKTFLDGDYDREVTTWNFRPITEQEAKDMVNNMNRNNAGLARLVSRELPDWKVEA